VSVEVRVYFHPEARDEYRAFIDKNRSICRQVACIRAETDEIITQWKRDGSCPQIPVSVSGYEVLKEDGWSFRHLYTANLGHYMAANDDRCVLILLSYVSRSAGSDHENDIAMARGRFEEFEL